MGGRAQKSDTATVPVLIVLAIILFSGAYVAGELIVLRVLKQDANHVVHSWRDFVAERIGADLKLRPESHPDDAESAGLANLAATNRNLTRVQSANILDLKGQRVDGLPHPEPYRFRSPRDRYTFERMVDTGSLEYLVLEPMASDGTQTIYYIPIVRDSQVAGGVRLTVDQTQSATLLRNAFQSIIVLTLAIAGIGLGAALFVLWRRIRESWKVEDEIRFLALHDMLTGLPNRTQFGRKLEQALENAVANDTSVGVICIDVDNFKDINDTLGHPTGDAVLRSVAKRILSASGPTSLVCRLSGDEFAVIVEDIRSRTALENIARRYLRSVSIPHEIDDHDLTSSISLGLAMAPEDGPDAETVLKNADLALYQAKAAGRNTYRFFTDEMDRDLRWRRRIEEEMRRAIGSDQFRVHYQPQFALHSGELTGFEALLRWNHPELGAIPPSTFIPIAEDSGMIGALGEWVLRTACGAALEWPEPVALAVNLSVAQFRGGDVAELIEQVLEDTGLPVGRLEVEVTETLLLHSTDTALQTLERLHDLGVRIALDDFGTGYSSLSYLSRFPLDKIKIDRSFVQRMTEDSTTAAIVEAIITLGHALDATVTAEGVETHEQAAILRQAGCHQVQGFLFGRPQETVEFGTPSVARMQEGLRQAIA